MDIIKVKDKEFKKSISAEKIQETILKLADKLNKDLAGQEIMFIGILNGSFMFVADLLKNIELPCQITFLKLASYEGTSSTGKIKKLIGLNENIENKTIVVLEDIIDTGITMESIFKQINEYKPTKILVATFLHKPEAFLKGFKIDYIGIEIPNEFIVGYGLDYDGFGRNLKDIYTLV